MRTKDPHRNAPRIHKRIVAWPPILERQYDARQDGTQTKVYSIDVMLRGRRIRETFDTKSKAEQRSGEIRAERNEAGAIAFDVPVDVRAEAGRATALLAPYPDATITAAVEYYIDRVLMFSNAPTIAEGVKVLLQDKAANFVRPRTLQDLQSRWGKFASEYGSRRFADITSTDVDAWLRKIAATAINRHNYRRKADELFRAAMLKKWCAENPVTASQKPRVTAPSPVALTVEQCSHLLAHAKDFGMLPYFVLGTFCGIRPQELQKLTWDKISIPDRAVVVESVTAKTGSRRVVHLNDPAMAWLQGCIKPRGPIVDPMNFRKRFDAWRKEAMVYPWPDDDCMRHSFGSYHLAAHKDDALTAHEMGNSAAIVHRHYKQLVTDAKAARFWSLRPDADSRIVPMQAAANG